MKEKAGSTLYWVIDGPNGTFRGQVVRYNHDCSESFVLWTSDADKNYKTYQEAEEATERWLSANNCKAVKG